MAWLSGWAYRNSITLSRASGAVTDYQMKILVGQSSGSSGADVHCANHCLSSFDDLRFTPSDGQTLLSYWIEEITGTSPNQTATVWVKCDSIGTSATTFYMYYGNASATAVSSGVDTFIAFEDFEWGADEDNLTTSGGSVTWTRIGSNNAFIDTAQKQTGTRSGRISYSDAGSVVSYSIPVTASDDIAIHFSARRADSDAGFPYVSQGNGTLRWKMYGVSSENYLHYYGSSETQSTATLTNGGWQKWALNNFAWSTGSYSIEANGTNVENPTSMQEVSSDANILVFSCRGYSGSACFYDNIFVRNYRATGPAWGTWGSEQQLTVDSTGLDALTELTTVGILTGTLVTPAIMGLTATLSASAGLIGGGSYYLTYLCTLTAAATGDVLEMPISSFQGRFRSGDPSYLSVVIPGLDLSAAIAAMADPDDPPAISIYMIKNYENGESVSGLIMTVDLEDIRIDEGSSSQSITLSGHRTITNEAKSVSLTGASYRNVTDGLRRYRCAPDLYLRPGDTVTVNDETFTADYISMAISCDYSSMEVAEE